MLSTKALHLKARCMNGRLQFLLIVAVFWFPWPNSGNSDQHDLVRLSFIAQAFGARGGPA
jgi:hypothetical protein